MNTLQVTTPARLHHLHLTSEDPERLSGFYERMLDCSLARLADGTYVLTGGQRRLQISAGPNGSTEFIAFALRDASSLEKLRRRMHSAALALEPARSPLFAEGSFATRDPHGRRLVFGTARTEGYRDEHPGRLQHVVYQATALQPLLDYYVGKLGFALSDKVLNEDGSPAAFFIRSDDEHHSLAFFLGTQDELDHHAYETSCWNDIRDWGDRFGRARIPMFWGPGRHGPGDNLFFMVRDPDGNKLEFSAELETMAPNQEPRIWPNTEYTLNYWGSAWMRS